jgi:hypothetical protein
MLEEYASCNLVVVTVGPVSSPSTNVFDRTTGQLVGEILNVDVAMNCPFGPDAGSFVTLAAGQFPDTTCVRSRCIGGNGLGFRSCPDAGI